MGAASSGKFEGLEEFLAIARCLSIRGAALALGKTPGAISLALQRLERRLGQSLFNRTTRKMALTEAGQQFLLAIEPAARAIQDGLDDIAQSVGTPAGTLKLMVERLALPHVIEPVLPVFLQRFPAVNVDITVCNRQNDFIGQGYDAGISIGSYIEQDMIAIRLCRPFQWAVFGSPDYFRRHGHPLLTSDLIHHRCIRFRRPEKGDIYRWEFVENNQTVRIEPTGPLTVNDGELMRALAVRGIGLIYSSTFHSSRELRDGLLEPALLEKSPGSDGLFLYFSKTVKHQPKLRAFIDVCTETLRS